MHTPKVNCTVNNVNNTLCVRKHTILGTGKVLGTDCRGCELECLTTGILALVLTCLLHTILNMLSDVLEQCLSSQTTLEKSDWE